MKQNLRHDSRELQGEKDKDFWGGTCYKNMQFIRGQVGWGLFRFVVFSVRGKHLSMVATACVGSWKTFSFVNSQGAVTIFPMKTGFGGLCRRSMSVLWRSFLRKQYLEQNVLLVFNCDELHLQNWKPRRCNEKWRQSPMTISQVKLDSTEKESSRNGKKKTAVVQSSFI